MPKQPIHNSGIVEGIFIASKRGDPTISVEQVHVIPGLGIEGDRYYNLPPASGPHSKPGRDITLIEAEVIEALSQEDGIPMTPGDARRNIVTRGVALNDLVGHVFKVGNIQLRGLRLCEPCNYLANRTDPRVLQSLAHRGGLKAEILTEGIIHLNDIITIA